MIASRLFALDSFQKQYRAILILSASLTIEKLIWTIPKSELLKEINWSNSLSIASILCQSSLPDHLEAALRISQTALANECSEEHKAAAVFILFQLTNIPAYKLALSRNLVTPQLINQLPLSLKFEINRSMIENSMLLNENVISINRFQKSVYDKSMQNQSLSISAPTSAGKSFILYQLVLEKIRSQKRIIYLVPTRALISQVERELLDLIKRYRLFDVNLTTIPREEAASQTIYILTQERLHKLFVDNPDFSCDLLLVDEAHKIDNGNRGILLERKLEELLSKKPNMEVYFSSPFTSNPELLLDIIKGQQRKDTVNTEFVAVNQNLIYVAQKKGKPLIWNLEMVTKNESLSLGFIELPESRKPETETKKMGYLASILGSSDGGTIIYANGASEAEEYAKILRGINEDEEKKTKSQGLKELIKLVRRTIHSRYVLSNLLHYKVSVHYGNLPLLIREEIERQFKLNHIHYLVCTSTLLEGMNLPAKSIFIRNPQRGRGKPLNENDFWNLAGRAGRLGTEFSGNIFCIEPKKWDIQPNPSKRKQSIFKALEDINLNQRSKFVDYIKRGSPRKEAESKQHFEFAFNYYYNKFQNGKFDPHSSLENELLPIFEDLAKRIRVPNIILQRNPGISPLAQQELLEYFEEYQKDYKNLIPVNPEEEGSYQEYISLIQRIGKTLAYFPPKLSAYRSKLILNWMAGRPLARLIKDSIKYYQTKDPSKKLDAICREVMAEIEDFARFRFVKESSCYTDILKFFFEQQNEVEFLDQIPDISLWLELGVNEETQISLLSIGFSRQTTILLSKSAPNVQMQKRETIKWIKDLEIENYDFSPIILKEIEIIKAKYSNSL